MARGLAMRKLQSLAPAQILRPRSVRAVACQAQQQEDVLLRSLSDLGEVAVLVLQGTHLVQEAMDRHKTAPTATAALGRTLLGAALLGAYRKEEEQIQIQFKGDGPLGSILAVADTKGQVKGRVGNPAADPPLRPDGKLNVGAAVGQGQLCVTRTHPGQPRPYTGIVNIVSGEVAEDLATYLAESEQTNSALALGVCIGRDLRVKSAGGYLVQVLPFCSDDTLDQLEQNLTGMPSMTQLLNQGLSPQEITDKILAGLGSGGSSGDTIIPRYGPCEAEALKGRMLRAVASLGAAEVKSILEEQGQVEVTCELCNEQFQFSEAEVMQYV
ncbi:hypothetical protein OEZ85_005914 [Tetradesmus obliquus]|uniref:33 kDa chaperonin n=1 Tax=Tetradesmus obliquus TaxID=3088 RepID=A0ABY8UF06_TETOB|nr:hypothetical protein OEZ85_005914 [Tetradesmus obliquus]